MRLGRSPARGAALDVLPSTGVPGARTSAERPEQERLGEILIRHGSLSRSQLAEALDRLPESGVPIGTLLLQMRLVDHRALTAAVAEQLNLRTIDLRRVDPDLALMRRLPEADARRLGAIPVSVDDDGVVTVVVAEPTDSHADLLSAALGAAVRLVVAPAPEVRRLIDRSYSALTGVEHHVTAFTALHGVEGHGSTNSLVASDGAADDAPVVQVVNKLITQALRDRASDIHIEPQDTAVRVRFRIDGALVEALTLPASMASAVASRIKVMAGMNIVERRRPQDGQIATSVDGRDVDVRVSTLGTIWGEKVVMRLLDKSRSMFTLSDLGMAKESADAYNSLIRSPYGMVICAGPTGSGKTTTLYASLTEIMGADRNITTIEDPVEYVFPSINQIQINEQAGVTFAGGLKAILRQDPDVILVGEIRDVDTARIAVQSALTGHLVLTSLHATDAVSALYRFLDMGIESFLVSSSVLAVVGQRLIRRMCQDCTEVYLPSPQELAFFELAGGNTARVFHHGTGCANCAQTGYVDRIGVYEVLTISEQMRELLVAPNPSRQRMRDLAVAQGMSPLREQGVRLVEEGMTTIAEIVRSIYTI
ncbi:MAG: GspE/PulE family protein [Sporichthyaceae bacterium]